MNVLNRVAMARVLTMIACVLVAVLAQVIGDTYRLTLFGQIIIGLVTAAVVLLLALIVLNPTAEIQPAARVFVGSAIAVICALTMMTITSGLLSEPESHQIPYLGSDTSLPMSESPAYQYVIGK